MKTTIRVLLFTTIILISACYPKPEGFIGLKDIENPEVIITNIQNGDYVSDASEYININAEAADFFGIKKVVLVGDEYSLSLYDEPFSFPIHTSVLLDTNYVYAIAYDTSDNTTYTDTICFYKTNTLIVVETIEDINLFDIDDPVFIDLEDHFLDSLNPSNSLGFELISNTNDLIADIYLDENILTISPNRYREGFTTITLAISAGDHRTLNYSFNLNIILSEPVIKVYVPDDAFKYILFNDYGFTQFANEDSIVVEEAEFLTNLELISNSICSVEGIQAFANLDTLKIKEPIETIDLFSNSSIKSLTISETNLSEMGINSLSILEYLKLSYNTLLIEMDLTDNTELKYLINIVSLRSLDVTQNTNLEHLTIGDSSIPILDLTNNDLLEVLFVSCCSVSQISFSTNSVLSDLTFDSTNNLEIIDLSSLTLLTNLTVHYSSLPSLDISNNIQLEYINLINNEFLIATYVWQLPLPGNVTLYKDDHNILYVP